MCSLSPAALHHTAHCDCSPVEIKNDALMKKPRKLLWSWFFGCFLVWLRIWQCLQWNIMISSDSQGGGCLTDLIWMWKKHAMLSSIIVVVCDVFFSYTVDLLLYSSALYPEKSRPFVWSGYNEGIFVKLQKTTQSKLINYQRNVCSACIKKSKLLLYSTHGLGATSDLRYNTMWPPENSIFLLLMACQYSVHTTNPMIHCNS